MAFYWRNYCTNSYDVHNVLRIIQDVFYFTAFPDSDGHYATFSDLPVRIT